VEIQPIRASTIPLSYLRIGLSREIISGGAGGDRRNENWEHLIRKSVSLAERIEDLAPALSPDAPNPEYPWPRAAPHTAPVEYTFGIWQNLEDTSAGHQFLKLIGSLFATAEVFL
jgi:hypothetical protein